MLFFHYSVTPEVIEGERLWRQLRNFCDYCIYALDGEGKTKLDPVRERYYFFLIPHDAAVGVCDCCGAPHFNLQNTLRWRRMFEESWEKQGNVLSPAEITALRQSLGMSMEDFATLVGVTRQSVSVWEKPGRSAQWRRTPAMMMKLVHAARDNGKIAVLDFLLNGARKISVEITLGHNGKSHARQSRAATAAPPKTRRRTAA